jgi:hypothetical protein
MLPSNKSAAACRKAEHTLQRLLSGCAIHLTRMQETHYMRYFKAPHTTTFLQTTSRHIKNHLLSSPLLPNIRNFPAIAEMCEWQPQVLVNWTKHLLTATRQISTAGSELQLATPA